MRDVMNWGVPLPRMFGIPVKVHWLFFLVTGGLFFRQVLSENNVVWWGDVFLLTVVALQSSSTDAKSVQLTQLLISLDKLATMPTLAWIPGHAGINGNETAE